MAASEISLSGSFLSEVQWARETIAAIGEAKIRDRPLGFDPASRQPDPLFAAFARRDLLFYAYVRTPDFNLGNSAAYTTNIATVHYYVERERHEEVLSVRAKIQELTTARAERRGVGLLAPGGHIDELVGYFAIRDLTIDTCPAGQPGEAAAYDANIHRLQGYLERVSRASARQGAAF